MNHPLSPKQFQTKILDWFKKHGRKELPWQKGITPYRVWISEIMLQQTQVQTVIPYFKRFMARFPNIKSLANAETDDVLHLWSGLGYYARARNIHKTAQIISNEFHGRFPKSSKELQSLPGIGKSTAGAILSISMNQRGVILDGNVKRVLARFLAIPGWPDNPHVAKHFWDAAEYYTPENQLPEYTQAMMDLGAMICTRTKPLCTTCPLKNDCKAHRSDQETSFPEKKKNSAIATQKTYFLILQNDTGAILLEKRPPLGIWGGLWSFPQFESKKDLSLFCLRNYGCTLLETKILPPFKHTFTHFHLEITPIIGSVKLSNNQIMEDKPTIWYNLEKPKKLGLPQPVQLLLSKLKEERNAQ